MVIYLFEICQKFRPGNTKLGSGHNPTLYQAVPVLQKCLHRLLVGLNTKPKQRGIYGYRQPISYMPPWISTATPQERVTRARNMAWLMTGLFMD
ncbi:MAG TPA: hypothetical protein DEP47_14040 [Chloroflexi bacterium]|nr:hypothetical protein [Chloroflexota bacterium]